MRTKYWSPLSILPLLLFPSPWPSSSHGHLMDWRPEHFSQGLCIGRRLWLPSMDHMHAVMGSPQQLPMVSSTNSGSKSRGMFLALGKIDIGESSVLVHVAEVFLSYGGDVYDCFWFGYHPFPWGRRMVIEWYEFSLSHCSKAVVFIHVVEVFYHVSWEGVWLLLAFCFGYGPLTMGKKTVLTLMIWVFT